MNIQQKKGGLCDSAKMRMKIFIEPRPQETIKTAEVATTTTAAPQAVTSSTEEPVDFDLQKLVLPNSSTDEDLLNQQLWSATYELSDKRKSGKHPMMAGSQQDSPVTPAYYDRPQSDLGFRPRPSVPKQFENHPRLILYHIEEGNSLYSLNQLSLQSLML